MKIIIIAASLIAAFISGAAQSAEDNAARMQFDARVAQVAHAKFPYVRLKLDSINSRSGNMEVPMNVTPAYSLTESGGVDFQDPTTIGNLTAYYLMPGDRIQAVLLDTKKGDGTRYITRVERMNSTTDPAEQVLSGVKTGKQNYSLGAPVDITFAVENRTQQEVTLRFPSGQIYDIWAQKDGKEIWRWSRGMFFTQALTSITLKPGERKVFAETWKQVDNEGNQVPPGSYELFAQLTTFQPRPTPVRTRVAVGKALPVIPQTTVSGIVENVDRSLGKLVQLTGTFRGWKPDPDAPACKPGPPVKRSDWAISDRTGCIFVTGPSGLDPTDDVGKRITVVGTVRKTAKGQPYIEAQSVTLAE